MTNVYVTTGENWPDALSAIPLGLAGYEMVMVQPDNLTDAGRELLDRLAPIERCVIVGGPVAVSDAVVAEIDAAEVVRLDGAHRYETRLLVHEYLHGPPPDPEPEPEPGPAKLDRWLGNSGRPMLAVPHLVEGGTVDGARLATNAQWIESGYCVAVFQGDAIVAQFGDLIGWGRRGGRAVALIGNYVYVAFHQSAFNPPQGGQGYGIRRYEIGRTTPTWGDAQLPGTTPGNNGANGVYGSVRWQPAEVVTMANAGGQLWAWLANGTVKRFNADLVEQPGGTPPARPPQIPSQVQNLVGGTPVITWGGKVWRGDCFVDTAILDSEDPTIAYTARNKYRIDHATGEWTWLDHLVVDPADTRVASLSEQAHDATCPVRKVGNLLFLAGMMGGLAVLDLTTKRIVGTVPVPWGFDVTPDGKVWTIDSDGTVKVRGTWNAAPATLVKLTGLQIYERLRITDAGDWLVGGWPGPRFAGSDPWGMVGTEVRLYRQGQTTHQWKTTLPWPLAQAPWDGPKAIATAGGYWMTTDLGRDKQPTNRVYRLSDGVKVDEWKPAAGTNHGWMDCAYGITLAQLPEPDGRYFAPVEDDGNALVMDYWRTYP